jgi:hypothetical protein
MIPMDIIMAKPDLKRVQRLVALGQKDLSLKKQITMILACKPKK